MSSKKIRSRSLRFAKDHPITGGNTLQPPISGRGFDIFDVLPDACFIVAANSRIHRINTMGALLLGNAAEIINGKLLKTFLVSGDQHLFENNLATSFLDHKSRTTESVIIASNGSRSNVEFYISPPAIYDSSTSPMCLVIARDISTQKKQELDLLRFTNLAHHTVNPIEITDTTGKIMYVNPAFENVSGYSKEELIGKNPNIFGSGKHPKAFWDQMWATITSGKVWVGEVINRRRNGDFFYAELLISPIVDAQNTIAGFFGIHRDISTQKLLEHRLIQAQKLESIGMLAAGIAHEVGNPLTSISSLVQIIQRTTEDDFTQEKLELIKNQVSRITRIIRDLVDFSRQSNYEVQATDINKCIRDAVEIVRVGKKAKDIYFDITYGDDIPNLFLVPDQFEQVIINLLINAVDALSKSTQTHQRAKHKDRKITVTSYCDDHWVTITIDDTGEGIAENDLSKIFEPFFTTKPVGEGTGLGLWVSYGIIKSFRGEITVKSEQGAGTCFTIRFPIHSHVSKG